LANPSNLLSTVETLKYYHHCREKASFYPNLHYPGQVIIDHQEKLQALNPSLLKEKNRYPTNYIYLDLL
jgi:hypothetical protein